MIIAAVTALALLFGGGGFSFDHIRDAANEVIQDKDKANQVIAITKQADEYLESFTDNIHELADQFVEMNENYDTTREEMDALSSQVEKTRKEFLGQLVALRFQMQGIVTAEEWQEMSVKRKQQ